MPKVIESKYVLLLSLVKRHISSSRPYCIDGHASRLRTYLQYEDHDELLGEKQNKTQHQTKRNSSKKLNKFHTYKHKLHNLALTELIWASQTTPEIIQPYRGKAERAQKYSLTLHASVYGCLALKTYQQVSNLGYLKKRRRTQNVGDFLENISPNGLYKDFEWDPVLNSERTAKGSIQNWLKDTVSFYFPCALMLLKVAIITYTRLRGMIHMWQDFEVIVFILKLYIALVRTWYVLPIETLSSLKWRREKQSESWFWPISFMIYVTILKPSKKPYP